MWDASSPIQRRLRRTVGGVAVTCALVLPWFIEGPSSPRALAGAMASSAETVFGESDRKMRIDRSALSTAYLYGAAVYEQRDDGTGVLVGQVRRDGDEYYLTLSPRYADRYKDGADLLYSGPVRSVDDAMSLVLAPDGMDGEVKALQDALWPVLQRDILGPMQTQLADEFKKLLSDLPKREGEQFQKIADELYVELAPEIDGLTNKLVARAWKEIGVWGVAEGIWRHAGNSVEKAWDGVRGLFGGDNPQRDERDFLTDERKEKLRLAMREEMQTYWKDNGQVIMEKTGRVLQQHEQHFLERFREEWAPQLYERVLKQAWQERVGALRGVFTEWAQNFARRRLVTAEGAPRLTFAYTIRSATGITRGPLLVIAPARPDSAKTAGTLVLLDYREGMKR